MTPEEREMINGLFDRMRSYGTPTKDRDAEAAIADGMRRTPDAGYMLVQSVLVQEHALEEASSRIKDLEEQVRTLEEAGRSTAPSGSGSFLGGLFGGGRPVSQPGAGSVPAIGSRAVPPPPPSYEQDQQRPWQQTPPQAPASGGFLRSAMATATGVAGGMLAAGAIRDLFGGSAHANPANPATSNPAATAAGSGTDTSSVEQARQDRDQDMRQDAEDKQARQDQEQDGIQDAADDDTSWDDGDDLEV